MGVATSGEDEDLCHTNVSHKRMFHLDACAGRRAILWANFRNDLATGATQETVDASCVEKFLDLQLKR